MKYIDLCLKTLIWIRNQELVTQAWRIYRKSWSRRLRLGLESRAVSTLVWKVAPSPLGLRNCAASATIAKNCLLSCCLRFGLESRAVSASVWKIDPSPTLSGKSRRIHPGLESRTVSNSVVKATNEFFLVAPSPR